MANIKEILVPDIGDFEDVTVIEIMVSVGSSIQAQDSLITIESDKASVELPSPYSGIVKEIKVKVGDKVSEGALVLTLDASEIPSEMPSQPAREPTPAASLTKIAPVTAAATPLPPPGFTTSSLAHASPSVRRFARALGVDLSRVSGSGPKGRILKEDVQAFVKTALTQPASPSGETFGFPLMPTVDFSKFGPIETRPLSRIKKLAGSHLHRNWVGTPHVTQHDEADITELETLRKAMSGEAQKQGTKLTLLAFVMKAVVATLKQFPNFNASLSSTKDTLILKQYFHIGIAVDTAEGLVVPVIRDIDKKGILQIAKDLGEMGAKARAGKLSPLDIQGGSFSISSLGGIGGTAFTPIINAPEVAVLGISKASLRPVFIDHQFVPRLMLPLSLSYDHRVIDGADGARFSTYLGSVLSNILQVVL